MTRPVDKVIAALQRQRLLLDNAGEIQQAVIDALVPIRDREYAQVLMESAEVCTDPVEAARDRYQAQEYLEKAQRREAVLAAEAAAEGDLVTEPQGED